MKIQSPFPLLKGYHFPREVIAYAVWAYHCFGLAKQGLAFINKIYRIEKLAREAGLNVEARQKLRDEKARPIWTELRA